MLNHQRASKNGGFCFGLPMRNFAIFQRWNCWRGRRIEELLAEFTSPSFLKAEMWLLDPLKKNLENVLDHNFG
jgi:hypothetical protein